jgi:hypothetical protein
MQRPGRCSGLSAAGPKRQHRLAELTPTPSIDHASRRTQARAGRTRSRMRSIGAYSPTVSEGLVPFLWVCGPSGVGKSSVGWEVFRQLVAEGVKSAYLDFDQVGFCRPAAVDDLDNVAISTRNLAVMWPNYRFAGARRLVASGIVHTGGQIQTRAEVVPDLALTVCRLRASHDELRRRIFMRADGNGPPLPGDEFRSQSYEWLTHAADDSIAEADEMERNDLGDVCVDTDEHDIEAVARLVRERVGI